MKRYCALLLLGALLLQLWGCGAQTPAEERETAETAAVTEAETEAPTVRETEPVPEEPMYLKVSSITFSLAGDSEDIYMGLVPREKITWESEDPNVISVENGVLTANSVGTTTIRASCGDRQLECTASCLAETEEELKSLDPELLRKPKRMVPDVELDSPCTFYDNAVLVGDSISLMMIQNESKGNYLGDLLVLARNGTSLCGLVNRFKNIYYQACEMNLEDAIAKSQVDRMYILLGANDIACEPNRLAYFDNWDTMLARLRDKTPDLEIVVISNTPKCKTTKNSVGNKFAKYNAMVKEDNAKLEQYCSEHGCQYLNLAYYIEDHEGNMALEYNLDGDHMNDVGYLQWIKLMRLYAEYELAGGKIS